MIHHSKRRTSMPLILPFAMCFAIAACSDKNDEQAAAQAPAKTQKQAMKSSVDRLVQWPEKDLRERARKAAMEQRWYKPSGNSALEYYLALRKKLGTPDESVETALVDILPYAVIGMDQAIANFDDKEALRLEALIRMADPNAPALARVSADLEKMKVRQAQAEQSKAEEAEAEAELADAAKAREEAAKKAREAAANDEQAPIQTPLQPVPAPVAAPPPSPVTAQATQAAPPQVQAPVPTTVVPPPKPARPAITPISTPAPEYPASAQKAGKKGQVVAEITISPEGDVTDVRIVNSSPPFVFDKTVLTTVRRWKFRGNGESTTSC
jgi:periplasmic protein TonB